VLFRSVQLTFGTVAPGVSDSASVQNLNVDIEYQASNKQTQLAEQFFVTILANDVVAGPTSSRELEKVRTTKDIPSVLRKVNGFVLAFRRLEQSLSCFSSDGMQAKGWDWYVHLEEVRIRCPSDPDGGYFYLSAPLNSLLGGDVHSLLLRDDGKSSIQYHTTSSGSRSVSEIAKMQEMMHQGIRKIAESQKKKHSRSLQLGTFPCQEIKDCFDRILR